MSSSCWDEGSDSDRTGEPELEVRGLVGHRKISPGNEAKLPRSAREEAVKVRPFPGGKRLTASGARALKWARRVGTQRRYVVPRVDESKSSQNSRRPTEPIRLTSDSE